MSRIYASHKQLVCPGQVLAIDLPGNTNCYREGREIIAAVKGQVRVQGKSLKLVPLAGPYIPKVGDVVIGVVIDLFNGRWLLDINSPYYCTMMGEEVSKNPLHEDLKSYFDIGDILSMRIAKVNEVNEPIGVKPWKLEGGCIINVNPRRVPRIVGKKKSMLNLLKEKTGSKIVVGQNGRIWVKGGRMEITIDAIKTIERFAPTSGLTDRIAKLLDAHLRGEK